MIDHLPPPPRNRPFPLITLRPKALDLRNPPDFSVVFTLPADKIVRTISVPRALLLIRER
ncbi:MAG: hypothetical protein N0A16_05120 [Blastocatellia bacterium]|nr:hypothetical protein [Blastocatellia bacterium]MCS7157094.1 hypothetical protein [Blastocatellia bacterium]MDW8167787.1 hypothetical protein [Acidobacteriota bacterium]MDW8256608.1 hypothetical protein [Acidobacteriota bacterium]